MSKAELARVESDTVDTGEPQAIQRFGDVSAEPTMSVEKAKERFAQLREFVKMYLIEGEDYGTIPGTAKPTLFKPGADKMCDIFGFSDSYRVISQTIDWERGLFDYEIECLLTSRRTGLPMRTGLGSCSSFESRYLYSNAKLTCPQCHKATVIKGKAEYGGGWICWKKAGKSDGCGAKFSDNDTAITSQPVGKIRHEPQEMADTKNTVLKMARKRALIDAVIAGTRSSGLFTQDIGDDKPGDEEPPEEKAKDAAIAKAHGVTAPVGTREAGQQVAQDKIKHMSSQDRATIDAAQAKLDAQKRTAPKPTQPAQSDLAPALRQSLEKRIEDICDQLIKLPEGGERYTRLLDDYQKAKGCPLSEMDWQLAADLSKAREKAAQKEAGLIDDSQRKRLWAIVTKRGWGKERAKFILRELWGYDSSSSIEAKNYDEIVTHFDKEPPPPLPDEVK